MHLVQNIQSNSVQFDFLVRKTSMLTSRQSDWEINDYIFTYLDNLWGPYKAYRFEYDYNIKCKYFNSRFWCPGTAGIYLSTVTWGDTNNWIVPPSSVIPKVINQIKREKCSCTLAVPEWTSAPYWPMIINEQSNIREYICFLKTIIQLGNAVGNAVYLINKLLNSGL